MKTLIALILLTLPLFTQAQEPSATVTTGPELSPEERRSKAKDVFAELTGTGQSSHKGLVRAGLLLKEQMLISLSYSSFKKEQKDSGGDLSTWNYVEQTSDAKMEAYLIEFTYFLFPTKLKPTPYARLGLGKATQRISYGYNRFKPWNGAICIGPCPTRAVEESDSGEIVQDKTIVTAAAGYSWTIVLGRAGLHLRGGVAYTNLPSIASQDLGGARKKTISGIEANPLAIELGLGVEIPLF